MKFVLEIKHFFEYLHHYYYNENWNNKNVLGTIPQEYYEELIIRVCSSDGIFEWKIYVCICFILCIYGNYNNNWCKNVRNLK